MSLKASLLSTVLLGSTVTAGCASILGIEDATCDPAFDEQCSPDSLQGDDDGDDDDGDDDVPDVFTELEPLCEEYCEVVTETCLAADGNQQYETQAGCVAVCTQGLEIGQPGDKNSGLDTAYCRYENALAAGTFGELDFDCATAGLGAAGACGGECDVYCRLMNEQCEGSFESHEACVAECEALPRTEDPFDFRIQAGNTFECRLWHVQATFGNAMTHCPHSAGAAPCVD